MSDERETDREITTDATILAEYLFEDCIRPYLQDLGSIQAQLALEKRIREIQYAARDEQRERDAKLAKSNCLCQFIGTNCLACDVEKAITKTGDAS